MTLRERAKKLGVTVGAVWQMTKKGRQWKKSYNQTERYKASRRAYMEFYRRSKKGAQNIRAYRLRIKLQKDNTKLCKHATK